MVRESVGIEVPLTPGQATYAVTRWPAPGAPALVAAHGIAANSLAWAPVASKLPDVDVIAPDLRGRGLSREVGGPYGIAVHADDLVRAMDHLGVERAVVAGHSMGGWVAAVAAVRHPDRFTGALLVDGGLGFPLSAEVDLDALLEGMLGPVMRKLRSTFASPEAFIEPWRAHPAFAGAWTPEIEAYLRRDIVGAEPQLRSACVAEAVRADAADELRNPEVVTAIRRMPVPAAFLHAERGLMNEPAGLYRPEVVEAADLGALGIDVRYLPGTNHYSIVLGDDGAAAVADAVRGLL